MNVKGQMGIFFIASTSLVLFATLFQTQEIETITPVPFLQTNSYQADSVLRRMSDMEKIGQILMLVAEPDSVEITETLVQTIQQYPIGGIVFKGFTPEQQFQRTKLYQKGAKNPLLISMFSPTGQAGWIDIPSNVSLATINNKALLQRAGNELAHQMRQAGTHLYFTPSLNREFSSHNRVDITNNVNLISQQLQASHILSSPTYANVYFPYERDSARLDSLLEPYLSWTQTGTSGMVVEPEQIHRIKLNSRKEKIIKQYLTSHTNYKGLLIGQVQDSLGDISDQVRKMMKAGTDLIIVQKDQLPTAFNTLKDLVDRKFITESDLYQQVHRIQLAKSWANVPQSISQSQAKDTLLLADAQTSWTNRELTEQAITLVNDHKKLLPFHQLESQNIHLLTIGTTFPDFLYELRKYAPISSSHQETIVGERLPEIRVSYLRQFDPIIIAIPDIECSKEKDPEFFASLAALQKEVSVLLVHFGDLKKLVSFSDSPTLVHAYDKQILDQQLTAQLLFGGIPFKGRIPKQLDESIAYTQGLSTVKTRVSYTLPEAVGVSSFSMSYIDSIVQEGINSFATPGCQILVAKEGNIIYNKSFGHHTYTRKRRVHPMDIYDIASVTKVAATTVAAMKMYEEEKIHPDYKLSRFFKHTKVLIDSMVRVDTFYAAKPKKDSLLIASDSNQLPVIKVSQRRNFDIQMDTLAFNEDSIMILRKQTRGQILRQGELFQLTFRELLTHTSGLPAGLPILPFMNYKDSVTGKYDRFYSAQGDSIYSIPVAANFFMRNDYWDSLWYATKKTGINPAKTYEYSDANMILVQQAIDSINQEPLDEYLFKALYEPLGMQHATFNPRENETIELERIVPTEYDGQWRGQLLRGYVHDPTAALLGGVSGNAGLFSNASDLAILFQMILNGGTYGGKKYYSPQTVNMFTRTQNSHRGMGFDKPPQNGEYIISDFASSNSYGHTGFTGTCVWVDPEQDLVFIFLSNRIHPSAKNWKLNNLRIRQRIHDAIYTALSSKNTQLAN